MNVAYVECQAGASGDMFLGAWLSLGIDESKWRSMLSKLSVDGYEICIRTVYKHGIRALKVDVNVFNEEIYSEGHHHEGHHHEGHHHEGHHHPHRHLQDIQQILETSELPSEVRLKSIAAFQVLAEAEAKVHGMTIHTVHFHEVGAVDAIVDIVGTMAAWYLAGMPTCYVSDIEIGGGTVWCDHGLMPVPAPATSEILRGFRTYSSGRWGETVTPTGAAILRVLCRPEKLTLFSPRKVGYGAGTKDLKVANVLRIQLGEDDSTTKSENAGENFEEALIIEANIDDMTPELSANALSKMIELGAMDAWITPIVMKKGRSAIQLHVLCAPSQRAFFVEQIERETTTIGVRFYRVTKSVLNRHSINVDTKFGTIQVKVAESEGEIINVSPEFEDCRKQAEMHHVPLKAVYLEAMSTYVIQQQDRTTAHGRYSLSISQD